MKSKMTLTEFKQYVITEAKKLYKIEVLKEEKEKIKKELDVLNESTTPYSEGWKELDGIFMGPNAITQEKLDAVSEALSAEEMRKKASGWATPNSKQQLDEKKYSDKASNFIGKEISHLQKDKNYSHDRAVAAAINVAKDKGYKVPPAKNESSQLFTGTDASDPGMQMYFFKIKHDNGTSKIKTVSSSEERARTVIANYLGAPENAVQFIKAQPIEVKQECMMDEEKPSAGLTHSEKSAIVKKAKAGEDIGHKGKGFKAVADKAAKEYGSKEAGQRVAAASMWKNAAK